MAVRDDITINWDVSPRIIEVSKDGASPTSLTVQDLYDTVRDLSAKPSALAYDEIIDAGGKETLSSTEQIVVTVTLYNAKIKFEERTSWTTCEILSGNIVAKDANGYYMNPIEPSAYVTVDRAKSSSGVIASNDLEALVVEMKSKGIATSAHLEVFKGY